MMIQLMWKNLTGLQKAKSQSQLNTSGVTLHATPMTNRHINRHCHALAVYYYGIFLNERGWVIIGQLLLIQACRSVIY